MSGLAVPNFGDAYDTSMAGPAFSNATEGDYWMASWCGTCANRADDDEGCSLTDVARVDRVPAQWVELDVTAAREKYLCLCWVPAHGYVHLLDYIEDPTEAQP